MRTRSGARPRIGMKSMIRTVPSAVSNSVSSTSVLVAVAPPRRRGARPAGAISQRPCSGVAEQRGEARARVEARQAQPVDRAVAADQRGRLGVADERVVLDPHGERYCTPRASLREHPQESQSQYGGVVVITGGTAGVGRATAERFARAGAKLAILARGEDRLAAAQRGARGARLAGGARDPVRCRERGGRVRSGRTDRG